MNSALAYTIGRDVQQYGHVAFVKAQTAPHDTTTRNLNHFMFDRWLAQHSLRCYRAGMVTAQDHVGVDLDRAGGKARLPRDVADQAGRCRLAARADDRGNWDSPVIGGVGPSCASTSRAYGYWGRH